MTHPINGLDDLLFIVVFGAQPYAHRGSDGGVEPAALDAIFVSVNRPDLFCRHADPAAAAAAHSTAFAGRTIAFADPLGMYILGFNEGAFRWQGEPVPDEWVRRSRGPADACQRLVFGPGDDDDAFLDEIVEVTGAQDKPVRGGFQILQHLEVGPLAVAGRPSQMLDDEFVMLEPVDQPPDCSTARFCDRIRDLATALADTTRIGRVAPRQIGVLAPG
jgi:hypothetical protein